MNDPYTRYRFAVWVCFVMTERMRKLVKMIPSTYTAEIPKVIDALEERITVAAQNANLEGGDPTGGTIERWLMVERLATMMLKQHEDPSLVMPSWNDVYVQNLPDDIREAMVEFNQRLLDAAGWCNQINVHVSARQLTAYYMVAFEKVSKRKSPQ